MVGEVGDTERATCRLRAAGVDITDGHQLDVRVGTDCVQVQGGDASDADNGSGGHE